MSLHFSETNEPVNENTVYSIGSVTKHFTTTLLGQALANAGKNHYCTGNERKVGHPIIYTDSIPNVILFIDTPTMPGTAVPIRQLRRHVLRSFKVMLSNLGHVITLEF